MYEVFFNESKLVFTSDFNFSSKDNIHKVVDIQFVDDVFELLAGLGDGIMPATGTILCRMSPRLLEELPVAFRQIRAAGGLVRDRHGRYLFIRRFGRWDLPKGAIEKGESAPIAAMREVQEECGVDALEIIRALPATFHLYRSKHIRAERNWVLKQTFWFEMMHHGDGRSFPQTEEDIEEVRWFDRGELDEVLASTYAGLRKMLAAYFRIS